MTKKVLVYTIRMNTIIAVLGCVIPTFCFIFIQQEKNLHMRNIGKSFS